MTRAIELLVVCGVDGKKKRPAGCWYNLVSDALGPVAVEEPADDGAGTVLRYRKVAEAERASTDSKPDATTVVEMPAWLTRDVAQQPVRRQALAPSRALEHTTETISPGTAEARRVARERGVIMHRMMQSLPDIAPDRRAEAAQRYLSSKTQFTAPERKQMAKRVLAALNDSCFAALFQAGSRAEVPIVGRLGDREITGVVDRLAVTADTMLIADYKTNRPPPRSLADAKARYPDYIAQLALYRAVLTQLYPGRGISAVLVWTETPELMEIPAADLDAALAASTSRETP